MEEADYFEVREQARDFREALQDLQELYELNEDEDITVTQERLDQEVENVHGNLVALTDTIEGMLEDTDTVTLPNGREFDLPKGLERTHGEFPGRGERGDRPTPGQEETPVEEEPPIEEATVGEPEPEPDPAGDDEPGDRTPPGHQ